MTTEMLGPPDEMAFEDKMFGMIGSIDDIWREGECLMVNFGGTPSKFTRAAKPPAATNNGIGWIRRDSERV